MKTELKFVTVLTLLLSACASTTEVVHITKFAGGREKGIVYSLPKTIICVEVPVTKTEQVKPDPEFAKAAENILKEKPNDGTSKYEIGKPVLTFRAERDGQRTFVAKIKQSPFSTTTTSLTLSGEGVLTDGTFSDQNKTIDYMVTTVEAVAKVAASAAKAASVDPNSAEFKDLPPKVQNKLKELETLKATRAAILLNAPAGAVQLLEKIDADIAGIMKLFLGTTKITTASLFFEVEPRHLNGNCGGTEDVDLFTLKEETVDLHKSLVAPRPPFLKVGSVSKGGQRVNVEISARALFNTDELARMTCDSGPSGIHYCIPGKAQVRVLYDGRVQEQKSTLIAQYGPVVALPNSTGSEKTDITASLDPLTGALLKVSVTGQAFDPKYIERVGNAANTVVAAEVEKHNAEVLANDELTRLKRQKDILQAKSDIGKLQTELEAAKVKP